MTLSTASGSCSRPRSTTSGVRRTCLLLALSLVSSAAGVAASPAVAINAVAGRSSSPPPIARAQADDLDTSSASVFPAAPAGVSRRAQTYEGFTDPALTGGTMLTIVPDTYPAGLGEPLNIVIAGNSDAAVLVDSKDDGGFLNWALSLNFSGNCLGAVNSGGQEANLGDGEGVVLQLDEIRENFGDIYFGTCKETFNGGNHFRYWQQNTTKAWFLAASMEMDLARQHDIIRNGYNLGRDDIISRAVGQTIPPRNVTNTTVFSGSSTYMNYTYQNDVRYVSGLLQNSSMGINHMYTVEQDGYPAIDGLVAVLTIRITGRPPGEGNAGAHKAWPNAVLGTLAAGAGALALALV